MLRKIILGIAALAVVFIPVAVNAEGVGIIDAAEQAGFSITCPDGVANCSSTTDYSITGIQTFVLKLLGGLLNFAALAAVLMLIVVGLRLVIAMGNQEQLQAAKKHLLWVLGGLAVIILSLLIVKNVTETVYESTLPPPECGNGILEEGEECDGSAGVGEGEECSADCKLLLECLTLDIDGLLGPDTDDARNETPNLAVTFVEPLATNCLHTEKTVAEMPLRGSGEPMCLSVQEFQTAYNGQPCNKTTGTREDIAGGGEGDGDGGDGDGDGDGDGEGESEAEEENEECDPATVANGEVGDYPDCEIVCDDGYELSEDGNGKTCEEIKEGVTVKVLPSSSELFQALFGSSIDGEIQMWAEDAFEDKEPEEEVEVEITGLAQGTVGDTSSTINGYRAYKAWVEVTVGDTSNKIDDYMLTNIIYDFYEEAKQMFPNGIDLGDMLVYEKNEDENSFYTKSNVNYQVLKEDPNHKLHKEAFKRAIEKVVKKVVSETI